MAGHIKDITNHNFSRLKVIEFAGIVNRAAKWRCLCNCGNEIITYGASLRSGATKSCGCYRKELMRVRKRRTELGATCKNDVFCFYKNHAIIADREFNLSKEEFCKLIVLPCVYCGACLTNERKSPKSYGTFKYTGLDRIDSSKGYIEGNVEPCCSTCNYMKRHHSKEVFLNHIKSIVRYRNL